MFTSTCIVVLSILAAFWHSVGVDAGKLPKPFGLKSAQPTKPVITEHPESVVSQGSVKRLYCSADGNPEPQISWIRDGVPLTHFMERGIVQMNKGGLDFIWINDKGEWPNTGTYQCIATNDFGNAASRKATVQIANELVAQKR